VEYGVESVDIKATTTDSKATVSGAGKKSLEVGSNTFKVYGIAENGTKKTYTIVITRKAKDGRDTNNLLSDIKVDGYDIKFEPDTELYKIESKTEIKKLNLTVTPQSEKAKVETMGNKDFIQGDNTVRIRVTAENGDIREYVIKVTIGENKEEKKKTVEEKEQEKKEANTKSIIIVSIVSVVVLAGVVVFIMIQKKKGGMDLFSDEEITDVVKEVLEERKNEENNTPSDK